MQFTPLDVDYQQEERAKTQGRLDELKNVTPQKCPKFFFIILLYISGINYVNLGIFQELLNEC